MLTNDSVNEDARRALKQSRMTDASLSVAYINKNFIYLYDGNGDIVYDFWPDDKMIKYKKIGVYPMDKDTKKMVKRLWRRHWVKDNFTAIMICTAVAGILALCIISLKKNEKTRENVQPANASMYNSVKNRLFQDENIRE